MDKYKIQKTFYAIYGIGGFAKEILPLISNQVSSQNIRYEIVFVLDSKYITDKKEFKGYKILSFEDYIRINCENKYLTVAFSDAKRRRDVMEQSYKNNILPFNVVASNAMVLGDVDIGDGSILCPFVTLTSDIKIGKCFQANIYSYVAHDCVIGDNVYNN